MKKYWYRLVYAMVCLLLFILHADQFIICQREIIIGSIICLIWLCVFVMFLDTSRYLPFKINKYFKTDSGMDILGLMCAVYLFVELIRLLISGSLSIALSVCIAFLSLFLLLFFVSLIMIEFVFKYKAEKQIEKYISDIADPVEIKIHDVSVSIPSDSHLFYACLVCCGNSVMYIITSQYFAPKKLHLFKVNKEDFYFAEITNLKQHQRAFYSDDVLALFDHDDCEVLEFCKSDLSHDDETLFCDWINSNEFLKRD